MPAFSFFTTLERNGEDLEVEVLYEATPRVPGTFMQPPEGGDVELVSVTDGTGVDVATSAAEEALLLRECYDRMDADFDDLSAAYDEASEDWADWDDEL